MCWHRILQYSSTHFYSFNFFNNRNNIHKPLLNWLVLCSFFNVNNFNWNTLWLQNYSKQILLYLWDILVKSQARLLSVNVWKAYFMSYGVLIWDQVKQCAPHVCCITWNMHMLAYFVVWFLNVWIIKSLYILTFCKLIKST